LLSKTAVSQLGERLWKDYRAFTQRELSEYEITYLFVDGIAERLRPGAKREPVLAAWVFTIEGRRVLLHMMAGSKEDAETVIAFFEDMKRRGLNDSLLVTSDGAAGIIKAIEVCFPRAARQRCLAPDSKVRAQAAYQAPSRTIARELAAGVVADYGRKYDSAVACESADRAIIRLPRCRLPSDTARKINYQILHYQPPWGPHAAAPVARLEPFGPPTAHCGRG